MYVDLMFVCMSIMGLILAEPSCSKFSYEESLLEKMVRTEHKFELVQAEFNDLRKDIKYVMKQITDLQTTIGKEHSAMKNDFVAFNETFSTRLSNFLHEANVELDQKEMVISRMSTDLQTMYTGLYQNLTDSISTPIIGFKATGLKDMTPAGGTVLVFPNVLFNIADGYSYSDGFFTAPVSGLYIFTVQLCTHPANYIVANVYVDQTEAGRLFAGDKDFHVCDSSDAIVFVETGAKVIVKVVHNTGTLSHDGHRTISFSGSLLNKG